MRKLTFSHCSILTANHLYVAHFTSPTRSAETLILIFDLSAGGVVLARIRGAPINVFPTIFAGVTVRAMTRVVRGVVLTSGAVQAWRTVT